MARPVVSKELQRLKKYPQIITFVELDTHPFLNYQQDQKEKILLRKTSQQVLMFDYYENQEITPLQILMHPKI